MRSAAFVVTRTSLHSLVKRSTRRIVIPIRSFSSKDGGPDIPGLPDSIRRVNEEVVFPDEYPGQNYAFNWSLNGDGVTPLKKSSFRITKLLDLKVAGLDQPKKMPLAVKLAAASKMPEAGSDALTFEAFDEVSQRTKDLLSSSDHLYCPEGHVPSTKTGVRIITNSATLAPDLLAYLERAPKKFEPESQPVTAYVLEQPDMEQFAGYAIEEIEVEVDDNVYEPKSVAAVVVVGPKPDIKVIAKGLELSHEGLMADEAERAAKKEAEEAAAKEKE
eukprot:CAMPEP_0194038474 /NCGR_PEP_ID=MMETSP0009_2-20130614/10710_1 /TAXON_ID=210454 /ORGANISM="Grammatophora oceanica, Strain CCMP 410" /LENGTH=273 /DNA_ID=CAMNT_0038680987 /DNA_START=27 /DNA_END=848 /DNA_ORIENTATION=+